MGRLSRVAMIGAIVAPAALARAESVTFDFDGACFCTLTEYTFKLTIGGSTTIFASVDCPPAGPFSATWSAAGVSGTGVTDVGLFAGCCAGPDGCDLQWFQAACTLADGSNQQIVAETEVTGALCWIIPTSESGIGLPLSGIRISSITMSGDSDGTSWQTCWTFNYERAGDCEIDDCLICADRVVDCDANGLDDGCEILGDPGLDGNGNGVIDACEIGDPDLDGDGSVDTVDLLMLLAAWGPCAAPCPPQCAADLDASCSVDVADLLALIAAWS